MTDVNTNINKICYGIDQTNDGVSNKVVAEVSAIPAVTGTVSVDNFPVTQPVSGTVTANAGTNLNTSALALETTLSTLNGKVTACDTSNTRIQSTYDGTNFVNPRIDASTFTLQVIEYEHHEIHAGSHFFVKGVQDLSINNVLDFTFQTPNTTKWAHLTWEISTESETAWYIYENAVATNPLKSII